MTDTLPSNTAYELNPDALLAAYRTMRTIRDFEERVHDEFATGEIPGFVHLYAGEEASAAGVCVHLDDRDTIASTHRGHGHCIAKGVDPKEMMAEIYGRSTAPATARAAPCTSPTCLRACSGPTASSGAGHP
jgi:TPP-dependent pyruvate/acetoin dehydrogenase alpha subunit